MAEATIVINEKELKAYSFPCYYCVNNEMPTRHYGFFVCVPTWASDIWRKRLEKCTLNRLSIKFEDDVKKANARVSVIHLVLTGDGKYEPGNPQFIEGTFLWGPESLLSSFFRSQNRALTQIALIQSDKIDLEFFKRKQEKIEKRIKKRELLYFDGDPENQMKPEKLNEEPRSTSSFVCQSTEINAKEDIPKNALYPEVIRRKVREKYASGDSQRKIVKDLAKEFKRSPKKSAIVNIIQE